MHTCVCGGVWFDYSFEMYISQITFSLIQFLKTEILLSEQSVDDVAHAFTKR